MSSPQLRRCNAYMKLVLQEDKTQARALLMTATPTQAHCISQVIHNILILPVSKTTKKLITKYKKLLQSIANIALNPKKRLKLIQSAAAKIVEVLWSVKLRLKSVLE